MFGLDYFVYGGDLVYTAKCVEKSILVYWDYDEFISALSHYPEKYVR